MTRSVPLLACLALLASPLRAGEAPKPPEKPKTHAVKAERFTIEVKTKGAFEAETMHEVAIRPEAWAELFVHKAVGHGAAVKKGDVVLQLDTRKIDDAIENLEKELPIAALALQLAREETAAYEKLNPLDRIVADRAKKHTDDDYARYQKIERPLAAKGAEYTLKRAKEILDYQQEELKQLEKMYKADDLTEETEEIILKRQRSAVDRATFGLEVAKANHEKELKINLPRRDVAEQEKVTRQAIAHAKATATLPDTLAKVRLELEKQVRAHEKTQEKLAKLKKDRAAMVVAAPTDGIVYYGPCVRGQWPKLNRSLDEGTKLAPHEVVLTVVQTQPVFVRANVAEKELHRLARDLEGVVTPVAYPNAKLGARLRQVTAIPVAAGQFGIELAVNVGDHAARIVPGLACDITITAYRKDAALTVPAAAVFQDEPGAKPYVYVQTKAGHEKRIVVVGPSDGQKIEITQGIKAGDTVLAEKPKGQ